jgi:hypothetical protein
MVIPKKERCVNMKNVMKTLMVCLIVTVALAMVGSAAIAQVNFGVPPIWDYPAWSSQPLNVPAVSLTKGDILIDNFEYWDSPYNHGWIQFEPAYPVYGYGQGYATIFNTVLDLQKGSRVLDVYRQASVFLLGTQYEKHGIFYSLGSGLLTHDYDPNDGDDPTYPTLSFDFRAPLGIESWDIFSLSVFGATLGDNSVVINIVPVQSAYGTCLAGANTTDGMYGISVGVAGAPQNNTIVINVGIGRGFLDGSWHTVMINLYEVVKAALDASDIATPSDYYIEYATGILATGQMFRLDDIIFRFQPGIAHAQLDYPDLFEMGPLYAQIFEPYRFLFIADFSGAAIGIHQMLCNHIYDFLLDLNNFVTDEADIRATWAADSGVDPNLDDPNFILAVSDWASTELGYDFTVDLALPIFSDGNLRIGGDNNDCITKLGTLGWNATVGGYGANAIQAFLLEPLPIFPYDGMPTYLPVYYGAIDAMQSQFCGQAQYGPALTFILESALWNAGVQFWPNIAALDWTPQYFEDLIVTIEVTNGVHSDTRTIPMSVVNYPVENYAPVLQLDIDDQLFYVGQRGEYAMIFIDPDCYIFSLSANPATTHKPAIFGDIRTDQENIFYQMTLNGMPSYQYGPWTESIINPQNGLISFTPKFEGAYDVVVTATDNRGYTGFGEITIFAVNAGTWLNHPPIILGGPTQPVTLKAGQEYILHAPNFSVEDPDGDQLYASCNIGSCGRMSDGSFMWKFQSNFPGSYNVEIVFYDIRGGYAIMSFFVDVKPWWSYPPLP